MIHLVKADFSSSFMERPKSSSRAIFEIQRPVRIHSFLPNDEKIQQDEDERDPKFMHLLKEELFCFWKRQKEEVLCSDLKRKHELPISRIGRAMKSNDQVKRVSSHSTVLLAKAIEMFILELTLRAWMQRCDIARAVRNEEIFDFLSDIIALQNYKLQYQFQVEEANDSQGNEFYAAYQLIHPNNIPVEEANNVQGDKFHLANQMVQLHNILCQFQVQQEANDGQGNEFHPAYQMAQPNNIPLPCHFQVQQEANDGQGNEFYPAHQLVQSNNIPVQQEANDGNEFHPAYQLVQPINIPMQEVANDGQGNEFHPAYQMVKPNNNSLEEEAKDDQGNEYHLANQMVQPNNIPASFISIQGIPAPLMVPPLIDLSPEDEFIIDGFLLDNKQGL
ncbi:unnamed protein product [Withania somnifera]